MSHKAIAITVGIVLYALCMFVFCRIESKDDPDCWNDERLAFYYAMLILMSPIVLLSMFCVSAHYKMMYWREILKRRLRGGKK